MHRKVGKDSGKHMNTLWFVLVLAILIVCAECYMVRDEPFMIPMIILANLFIAIMVYALRYI